MFICSIKECLTKVVIYLLSQCFSNINCANSYVVPMLDLKVLGQGYHVDIGLMLFQYQISKFQYCSDSRLLSVGPTLELHYLTIQCLANIQPML